MWVFLMMGLVLLFLGVIGLQVLLLKNNQNLFTYCDHSDQDNEGQECIQSLHFY
jgi:hypothetical protein